MFKPLLPLRLNFTGTPRPAFISLKAGGLSTGAKKPEKLYSTVTLKLHEEVLPLPSLAVAVTVVVPIGKTLPAGALVVMVAVPQLSLPVTLKFATVDVAVLFNGK